MSGTSCLNRLRNIKFENAVPPIYCSSLTMVPFHGSLNTYVPLATSGMGQSRSGACHTRLIPEKPLHNLAKATATSTNIERHVQELLCKKDKEP